MNLLLGLVMTLYGIICMHSIIFSSYCIDVYNNVQGQDKVYLLRFFARKGEAENFVPPFIEVVKDVYSDPNYKLANIARKPVAQ